MKPGLYLLSPFDVRFGNRSMNQYFQDKDVHESGGPDHGPHVLDVVAAVTEDPQLALDFPPLTVVYRAGCLWCVDGNRRLYVFQELARRGHVHQMAVHVVKRTGFAIAAMAEGGFEIDVRGWEAGVWEDRPEAVEGSCGLQDPDLLDWSLQPTDLMVSRSETGSRDVQCLY